MIFSFWHQRSCCLIHFYDILFFSDIANPRKTTLPDIHYTTIYLFKSLLLNFKYWLQLWMRVSGWQYGEQHDKHVNVETGSRGWRQGAGMPRWEPKIQGHNHRGQKIHQSCLSVNHHACYFASWHDLSVVNFGGFHNWKLHYEMIQQGEIRAIIVPFNRCCLDQTIQILRNLCCQHIML